MAVNCGAGRERRARKTARIAQRLHIAATTVEHGADIPIRSRHFLQRVLIEHADLGSMPRRMHCSAVVSTGPPRSPRDRPRAACRSVAPHMRVLRRRIRSSANAGVCCRQSVTMRRPRSAPNAASMASGSSFDPGLSWPPLLPDAPQPGSCGFEHDRVCPPFGEMQRRRQSGQAATNDRNRHILVDVVRRRWDSWNRGVRINARRHGRRIVGWHRQVREIRLTRDAARGAGNPWSRACCGY